MKDFIRGFCNVVIVFSILFFTAYISFFTDIPSGASNEIKQIIQESKYEFVDYSSNFIINDLTIKMNTYYYEKLTDDQKKIYASIANGVANYRDEFSVRDYSPTDKDVFANETSFAIEAFINDHPEVFYLKSEYSTYIVNGLGENIGYVKLNYTEDSEEKIQEKYEQIKAKVQEYVDEFSLLETQYEKEISVHDKLAYSVEYSKLDELPRKYHTIEGTLIEGIGVCDSFSKSLQIIYSKLGIDSIIVLGETSGGPHAWNLVRLDDGWYHVDLTSSRSIMDDVGIVNHAYFNVSDGRIKLTNSIDTPELLPEANATKYYYYSCNDLIVQERDIRSRLQEIYDRDINQNYIEFYLEGDVSNSISTILTTLKNIDRSFIKDSKLYYYNIQNAIVVPKN